MIFDRQQQHLLLEGKEYTPEDIARFIAEGAFCFMGFIPFPE
jgi:O-succinylbenzoic acid--CoA ligase